MHQHFVLGKGSSLMLLRHFTFTLSILSSLFSGFPSVLRLPHLTMIFLTFSVFMSVLVFPTKKSTGAASTPSISIFAEPKLAGVFFLAPLAPAPAPPPLTPFPAPAPFLNPSPSVAPLLGVCPLKPWPLQTTLFHSRDGPSCPANCSGLSAWCPGAFLQPSASLGCCCMPETGGPHLPAQLLLPCSCSCCPFKEMVPDLLCSLCTSFLKELIPTVKAFICSSIISILVDKNTTASGPRSFDLTMKSATWGKCELLHSTSS